MSSTSIDCLLDDLPNRNFVEKTLQDGLGDSHDFFSN
jgi:hypothetical protein